MKLSDALPDWAWKLPRILGPSDLAGLDRVRASNRGLSRFRRVDYVCRRGHHLAEVLDVPEGRLLLMHGQDKTEIDPRAAEEAWRMFEDGGSQTRYRETSNAVRVADLADFRDRVRRGEVPPLRPKPELACRCGRHVFDLLQVLDDLDASKERVVLARSRTAR